MRVIIKPDMELLREKATEEMAKQIYIKLVIKDRKLDSETEDDELTDTYNYAWKAATHFYEEEE